ncbi:MAG: alpha/beta hydrolase [Chloroflexales bacterium]|nr:alpha/beta hydrolase [Chloroflexales bacterium]
MITPRPLERRVDIGPVSLMVYEWPGEGPAILLAHATSFHARCWDQVVAHLPGRRCIAFDQRGHGLSDKPAPPYRWRAFAEDLVALGRALELRGAVGVGHSLGGYATALAAALDPALFAALLLVDPVIFPPHVYGQSLDELHFAARRRNEWDSPEAMYERFRHRPPFSRWKPEVLRDYCQRGLVPAPGGAGYVLACPPTIEAAIYVSASEESIYPELATIQAPTVVLRGHPHVLNTIDDMSASPTAPDLAAHFRHGRDVELLNHSHFIPMETPTLVAGYIRDLLPA